MNKKGNTTKASLGSGYLYYVEFEGNIPEDAVAAAKFLEELAIDENRLGLIQAGCTLTYTTETYDVKDDNGEFLETYVINDDAILKSGILTWDGNTLGIICNTARVTDDTESGMRVVKIGGVGNDNGKKYVIIFKHKKGNRYVAVVGSNTAGLTLEFMKDKETVNNAEFKASAMDSEGTKVIYFETGVSFASEAAAASVENETVLGVTSAAGSTSGKTVLTVVPEKATGNTYSYKTSASVTEPTIGSGVTGYTSWDGSSEITATTGNEIVVVELDSNNKVVKFGKTTVTSKA